MNATQSFWQQALDVWEKGGSLMPILAALSVYAYYVGFDLWFRLRTMLPSQRDGKLIAGMAADPEKAAGRLHLLLRHCLGRKHDRDETRRRFEEARTADASFLGRRIRILLVLTSVVPLLGLRGISEALATTQTGLLIAIPAFVLAHFVSRSRHEWLSLLRRLECHALQANVTPPENP